MTYHVYINGKLRASVKTKAEAWRVIGQAPFGSVVEVRDAHCIVLEEFIPL